MKRQFILKNGETGDGSVIYWMSRDQRISDNRALAYAQHLAIEKKKAIEIIFGLSDNFLGAGLRQFDFMLRGLEELNVKAATFNIKFTLLCGDIPQIISNYVNEQNADSLIVDFDPLKIKRYWKRKTAERLNCPMIEVDAHNIVPCRVASEKQEFAAYTFRPKINKLLNDYLDKIPQVIKHPFGDNTGFIKLSYSIDNYDTSVGISNYFLPGEIQAGVTLDNFIMNRADKYAELRNDPSLNYQSDLSPYLHFGQISAERIAIEIMKSDISEESKKVYLEELIVRRELSDNYCFFNESYSNINGFPAWALASLRLHQDDKRDYIYCCEQFENALTHDIFWNASQKEMVITGKMHGYMRMYWAKKILEWTSSPDEAMEIAVYLNDKYQIDGRDPNGYTGIAWSIGGVHDRPWFERPVFGKIRYMNDSGLKRKFDISKYVNKINKLK